MASNIAGSSGAPHPRLDHLLPGERPSYTVSIVGAPKVPRPKPSGKLPRGLGALRDAGADLISEEDRQRVEEEANNLRKYKSPKVERAEQNIIDWWAYTLPLMAGEAIDPERLWHVDYLMKYTGRFIRHKVRDRHVCCAPCY